MGNNLNSDEPGNETNGDPIPGLPQDDEATKASEVLANVMVAGLRHAGQELISDLRANDPEFQELDQQITEGLKELHGNPELKQQITEELKKKL